MRDLLTANIPAALVTAATAGYATPDVLRNWIARSVFETPSHFLPEPRAGRPRFYPRLAVYEAAMLAWAAERGFPIRMIKGAWSHRKQMAPRLSGWENADFIKAVEADGLREFEPESDFAWGLVPHSFGDGTAATAGTGHLFVDHLDNIRSLADRALRWDSGFIVIYVGDIVRKVDHRLALAGMPDA